MAEALEIPRKTPRTATSATLRIGNVGAIPSVFKSLELNLESTLREVGLSASIFNDPEALVPYATIDELFRLAVSQSSCEHFGLLVGMAPPDLGLPGFLMQYAPTAQAGLEALVASMNRVDSGAVVGLALEAGVITLSYSVTAPDVCCIDQICDAAIAIGFGILRRAVQGFTPIEIRLPRRIPADPALFQHYFSGTPIKFNACEAAIDFHFSILELPLKNSDPILYRFLQYLLARDGALAERSMAEQIRRILPGLIRQKHVSTATIAQMFGVHPRTIARRLAEDNVTLHDLVQHARFEAAQKMLRTTNLTLMEIAASLHYSDASAFTRAFRQKFGLTPSVWRNAQRVLDIPALRTGRASRRTRAGEIGSRMAEKHRGDP